MIFERIWNIWPFRNSNEENSRRKVKKSVRWGNGSESSAESWMSKVLSPWESTVVAFQSVVIWERPTYSVIAVILANIIYWYLANSSFRLFYVISIMGLIIFLYEQWRNCIWPEIRVPKSSAETEDWTPVHPKVLSVPEVSRYLSRRWDCIQEKWNYLCQLRRKDRFTFTAVMVGTFTFMFIIGRMVSGVVLLHSLMMAVLCGPAIVVHLIPKSVIEAIQQICIFSESKDQLHRVEDCDLNEFLPEENSEEVQSALGIPFTSYEEKDENKGTQKSSKSKSKARSRPAARSKISSEVGNTFTVGLSASDFPSLEDSVADTLEESDLALPEVDVTNTAAQNAEGEMNFVPTHFEDSSDEEEFTVGLAFNKNSTSTQLNTTDASENVTLEASNIMSHLMDQVSNNTTVSILSTIGQHLSSAMAATAESPSNPSPQVTLNPPSESGSSFDDDDEDFELISDDDLQ
ncbi:UNVERIFIED_CONTAM: hypothetical protein RMT77_009643 [Armadillidium vulgare]